MKIFDDLEELEKEFQNKLQGHYIAKPNKDWIPEKQFIQKQLEKKKYKSLKNVDINTLIEFESDLIKEQEKEIRQKLKKVNKAYRKLGKDTIKINRTFEYQLDVRIFKEFKDEEKEIMQIKYLMHNNQLFQKYEWLFRQFSSNP